MRVRPELLLAMLITRLLVALPCFVRAQSSAASFYAGKTLTTLIGFPPGGSYDAMRSCWRPISGASSPATPPSSASAKAWRFAAVLPRVVPPS